MLFAAALQMAQFTAESSYGSRKRDRETQRNLSVDIYQHPASGASSIRPTYYECVINFLKDGDEIVALHLLKKKKVSETEKGKTSRKDAEDRGVKYAVSFRV